MEFLMHILIAIFMIVVFSLIGGVAVMLLWNWLMPLIFGLSSISFWEAVGLTFLCNLLFGGSRS